MWRQKLQEFAVRQSRTDRRVSRVTSRSTFGFESNGIRAPTLAAPWDSCGASRYDKIFPREYHRGDLAARLSLLSRHDASKPSGVLLFIVPALSRLASGTHPLRTKVRNPVAPRAPLVPQIARGSPRDKYTFPVFIRTPAPVGSSRRVATCQHATTTRHHVRPLAILPAVFQFLPNAECWSALICISLYNDKWNFA